VIRNQNRDAKPRKYLVTQWDYDAQPVGQHGRCAIKPRSAGYLERSAH
jgi:hypothetical protein